MDEPEVMDEPTTEKPPSLPQKFFKNTLVKITVILLAILTGGLLVGSVVGYFTLMEKLEAGTLEEISERLPEDTQVVLVFRGAGELGRDFMDVLTALPQDPDRVAEIEDKYNINLDSPWDLYETGIDPLRPVAFALLHADTQLVEVEVEEGEDVPDFRVPELNAEHSVVAVMVPVHNEEDALEFAIDLVPLLGVAVEGETVEELDMRRATSRAVSLGDSCALGVENGYLFVILSGDQNFRAGDELERVMRVEPSISLWSSEDFAQQRALTDENWNFMTWTAPSLGERSITRFVRGFLQSSTIPDGLLSLMSEKLDVPNLELGVMSTVSHISPELAHFRMVMDLSSVLGADPIHIGMDQQGREVGSEGIFPLVSGTPLIAARFSVDMDYFWDDWLSQNQMIQDNLVMMPPTMVESVIENMTGNISLAVVARDNPLTWSTGDDIGEMQGLIPSNSRLAYPIEMVMGVEFHDIDLLVPELETWGMVCEPSTSGIRWCQQDEISSIGLTADHLIVGFGVERRAEIEAVASGEVDNFYSSLNENRTALLSGPDVFGMVFFENMAEQSLAPYFNDDIVKWLDRQESEESIRPLIGPVLDVLARPPVPSEVERELTEAVAPIFNALTEAASIAETENQELEAELEEMRVDLEDLEAIWQTEMYRLIADDPDSEEPERSPELLAMMDAFDALGDRASDADNRNRALVRHRTTLEGLVQDIGGQADVRQTVDLVGQHLAVMSTGVQFWKDAAMVVDLHTHPVDGDFVSSLLTSIREEVGSR